MPVNPDVKNYQKLMKEKLSLIYPANDIETEWYSIKGNKNIYSPRVDLAVGPFATERRYEDEYDDLMKKSRIFVESLITKHNENLRSFGSELEDNSFEKLFDFNKNARCLLCIEIENEVSRKHLIGALVNVSALGRIGILIPWTPEKLKAFIKLRNYLKLLKEVGKNTFKTDNVLILTKEQFDDCLTKIPT